MFEAVLRTAILKPIPNETLGVISNAEQLVVLNPPIHFTQVHILVLGARPGANASFEVSESRLLVRARISGRGDAQEDEIGEGVSLAIIVKKEKHFVAANGASDVAAELIEVIGRFGALIDDVDGVVGIKALVTIELEASAMKIVCTGFGHDVYDRAAGVAQFGGIGVGINLEFLNGVFAELIGSAARTSTPDGLAEEGVVVI